MDGEVTVTANDTEYALVAGDGISFSADQEHVYETGGSPANLFCIVAYPAS
jgi:quercetin dioxygenase-like cupin family protein